ncbi:MAG: hypothetical protein IPF99_34285 [Deltaproteobacteria bacterium]|nr:hypothetical protein [Deltaproteobacteria bacterium]
MLRKLDGEGSDAPAPAWMNTCCPRRSLAASTSEAHAVSPASGSAAACRWSILAGLRATWDSSMATSSAQVPGRRCVGEEITSSPGLKRVTREPTATTSPETSSPVICGRR